MTEITDLYYNCKMCVCASVCLCVCLSVRLCTFFWNMRKDRNLIIFAKWPDIKGWCTEIQTKIFTFSFKSRVSPNVSPRQNHITTNKLTNISNGGFMERYGPTEHCWTVFKYFRLWPRPWPHPKSCKSSSEGSLGWYNSGEHICIIFICFRHHQVANNAINIIA